MTLIFNIFLLKMTLLTLLSVNVTIIRQGGQDDPSFFSHPSLNPLAPSETKALLQKVLADEPTSYQPPALIARATTLISCLRTRAYQTII